MDVYFQPLVYDLLDMFVNGVRTYDASKGEYFELRAVIIWTITDYPGLGSVSGFGVSGEAACGDCHSLIRSLRHGNGSKSYYVESKFESLDIFLYYHCVAGNISLYYHLSTYS
jgi:hypothetical protein